MKPSKTLTATLLLFCISTASHHAIASRIDAPVRAKQNTITTLDPINGFSDAEYIMGNYRKKQKLRITDAGSYALTLTDISSQHPLKKLGATITFANGSKVGALTGSDSAVFELQPGIYKLTYFAKTYKPRKSGEFSITLLPYTTDITSAAVPIPAATWLFGSGLLGLAGLARRYA